MNQYTKNINRIEFVVTNACTGRCRHCSEGEHENAGEHIDAGRAAQAVIDLCRNFAIKSVMTFGGEPMLYADTVCSIHDAARQMNVPKRQLITNGFFSRNVDTISAAALKLAAAGVNDILLSVDAFHQETIPLGPVRMFALAAGRAQIPLRVHPAWLVSREHDNPYNRRTREIMREFEQMGITASDGNVIFPSGNAIKYLGEYFAPGQIPANPYEEDPCDVRSVSILPDGSVLGGNIYQQDILEIIENYRPGL